MVDYSCNQIRVGSCLGLGGGLRFRGKDRSKMHNVYGHGGWMINTLRESPAVEVCLRSFLELRCIAEPCLYNLSCKEFEQIVVSFLGIRFQFYMVVLGARLNMFMFFDRCRFCEIQTMKSRVWKLNSMQGLAQYSEFLTAFVSFWPHGSGLGF